MRNVAILEMYEVSLISLCVSPEGSTFFSQDLSTHRTIQHTQPQPSLPDFVMHQLIPRRCFQFFTFLDSKLHIDIWLFSIQNSNK